jgi:hypothetical protein
MLATIVDLDAMWKILVAAFAVGVGVTAVFGQGALAASRLAEARRERRAALLADGLLVGLAAVVCLAAIVIGFLAMMHKSS